MISDLEFKAELHDAKAVKNFSDSLGEQND